jgi:hypothetical protein
MFPSICLFRFFVAYNLRFKRLQLQGESATLRLMLLSRFATVEQPTSLARSSALAPHRAACRRLTASRCCWTNCAVLTCRFEIAFASARDSVTLRSRAATHLQKLSREERRTCSGPRDTQNLPTVSSVACTNKVTMRNRDGEIER